MILILITPFLLFFKPRVPESHSSNSRRQPSLAFWMTPVFAISQLCNVIESLGYFLPPLYLPTYARSTFGTGNFLSTLTIILLNGAGCVGNISMGLLVDKLHFTTCVLISTVGTAIAVFCLWGLSTNLGTLYVFCLAYGLFAACWASTWPGIVREVVKKQESADSGMVFASLTLGKGIGNLVSGPLSQALLRASWKGAARGYGSGYGTLIVFTGVTAVVGGCSFAARRVGWL